VSFDDDNDGGLQYWAETGMAASMHSDRSSNMNINDLSQSKYLKTKDVPAPRLLTIKRIEVHNVAKDTEPKQERPIMFFEEMDKPMVVNSTNLKRCAKAMASEETDDWVGRKIVLYTDEDVEFGGEIVGGLRLRRVQGQAAAAAQAPIRTPVANPTGNGAADMDDDIPF